MIKPRTLNVPIDQVRIDGGTQVRKSLDVDRVDHYTKRIDAGDKFPSLQTFFDGSDHWLADGFHRLHAHRRRKSTFVQVDSRPGTKLDALWFALAANKTNGLPMTTADKAKAIGLACASFPHLSARAIADQIGVDDHTVAKHRPATCGTSAPDRADRQAERRQGRDGKLYPATQRRAATDTPPNLDDIPMEDIAPPVLAEDLPPLTADQQAPPAGTDAPPPTDDVGTKLPESLGVIFARRGEIKALVNGLRSTATEIRQRINRGDTLYSHLATSAFFAHVENAAGTLKAAIPFAVCPYCRAGTPDAPEAPGCKACRSQGWVGELTYQVAPDETKPARKG